MILHWGVLMVLSSGLMTCQALKEPRSALRKIMEEEGTWDSRFMADSPREAARNFIDLTAMEVARVTNHCDDKCETAVNAMKQELEELIENIDSEDKNSDSPSTAQTPEPEEEETSTGSTEKTTTSTTTTPKPPKNPKRSGNSKNNNSKKGKNGNSPGGSKGGKGGRAAVEGIVKTSLSGLNVRTGEKARVARHGTMDDDDLSVASGSGNDESSGESDSDDDFYNDTKNDNNDTAESSGNNKKSDTKIAPEMARLGTLSLNKASDTPNIANHGEIDNDSDENNSLLTIQSISDDVTSPKSSSSRTNSDSDNTNSDNSGLLDSLLDMSTSIKTTPFNSKTRASNRMENNSSVNSPGALTGNTKKCSAPDCPKGRSGSGNTSSGAAKTAGRSSGTGNTSAGAAKTAGRSSGKGNISSAAAKTAGRSSGTGITSSAAAKTAGRSSGKGNTSSAAAKTAGRSQRRSKRQAGGEVEGQVYILYCRAEGDFMKYGNHRSLCGSCMAIKSLPRNRYFPKFFNQVHCGDGDSTCLKFEKNTGHGQCLERNLHFKIFENFGTTRYPEWRPTTVRVPTCCECVLNANSKFTQLFQ